jgi:transcriptional regulator with XRE-family HTH domain
MELGTLLSTYRKEAGLTIDELAARSGVPKGTINKIIAGTTKAPTLENIRALAAALGKTLDDFDSKAKKAPSISDEALTIARKYEALDSTGRGAVSALIDYYGGQREKPAGKIIPFIQQSMAAGSGEPDFGNVELDTYEAPVGSLAEFACRVHGDSLEPLYSDQDVALAVKRAPKDGEIGVWIVDGEYKIKQYAGDPYGNMYLFAVNRDRADTDQTLRAHEEHSVYCLGTLLTRKVPLP